MLYPEQENAAVFNHFIWEEPSQGPTASHYIPEFWNGLGGKELQLDVKEQT